MLPKIITKNENQQFANHFSYIKTSFISNKT